MMRLGRRQQRLSFGAFVLSPSLHGPRNDLLESQGGLLSALAVQVVLLSLTVYKPASYRKCLLLNFQ